MITLICGRCRAGKTTYSKQFENVIHLDDLSVRARERYPNVLKVVSGRTDDIVVEGVYETAQYREELLRAYKGDGAKCIWLDTPLEVIARRMMPIGKPNTHFVVPKVFEPPTYAEGWDEIEVIHG